MRIWVLALLIVTGVASASAILDSGPVQETYTFTSDQTTVFVEIINVPYEGIPFSITEDHEAYLIVGTGYTRTEPRASYELNLTSGTYAFVINGTKTDAVTYENDIHGMRIFRGASGEYMRVGSFAIKNTDPLEAQDVLASGGSAGTLLLADWTRTPRTVDSSSTPLALVRSTEWIGIIITLVLLGSCLYAIARTSDTHGVWRRGSSIVGTAVIASIITSVLASIIDMATYADRNTPYPDMWSAAGMILILSAYLGVCVLGIVRSERRLSVLGTSLVYSIAPALFVLFMFFTLMFV